MNVVFVQIISGLDVYEGYETPPMETLKNEQMDNIKFRGRNKTVYVKTQS